MSHLDDAPRVQMGGRDIIIVGGDVSTISARADDEMEEVDYPKGRIEPEDPS